MQSGAGLMSYAANGGRRLDDADLLTVDPSRVTAAMKVPTPSEPSGSDDELLAIDLMLGLLTEDDLKTVERRMREEPPFARFLKARLASLAELARGAAPAEPSAQLWDRIASAIDRQDQQP